LARAGGLFLLAGGPRHRDGDGALAQRLDMRKEISPACSRSTSPSSVQSERTSRRRGASFRSPERASNSFNRCDQLSGFHKRAIVI